MSGRKLRMQKVFLAFVSFIVVVFSCEAYAAIDYTVKDGDTLYRIAKKHKVSVKAVQDENGISPDKLRPGMTITIPANGKTVRKNGKQARKSQAARDKTAKAGRSGGDFYHKVRKGETLASIARKYSVEAAELKRLNHLKSARVKKGQRLLVRQSGPGTYIVRKGDTIEKIAKRFKMDPADLMSFNELDSSSVRPGQKLFLEERADSAAAENRKAEMKKIEEDLKEILESEEFKAEDPQNRLVTLATTMMNVPYKFGGNSILGIDCSAYVKKVYGLLDRELPRTAREQFNAGTPVEKDQLATGDLVFFRTYARFPSHVGIYLGNDLFIHASSRAKKVTIDNLETPYYLKRFIGSKRLLNEGERENEQAQEQEQQQEEQEQHI